MLLWDKFKIGVGKGRRVEEVGNNFKAILCEGIERIVPGLEADH
jgi:hypothetical protein